MVWGKKKNQVLSYFGTNVTLEGRLCFSEVIRIDGRVNGDIVSSGSLIIGPTAVVTGNILVESLVLLGTIYGSIKAYKTVQLSSISKVYGHISYGELSLEGALHEGSSHKLTEEEIEETRRECLSILEESANSVEKSHPDEAALEQFTSSVAISAEKRTNTLLGKKQESAGAKKHHHHHGRPKTAPTQTETSQPSAAASADKAIIKAAKSEGEAPSAKKPEASPVSNAVAGDNPNESLNNGGGVAVKKAEMTGDGIRPSVKRTEGLENKDQAVKKVEPVLGNGLAVKKGNAPGLSEKSGKAEPAAGNGQVQRKDSAPGPGEKSGKAEPTSGNGQAAKKDSAAGPGEPAVKKTAAPAGNGEAVKKTEAPPKTWESIKKQPVAPQSGPIKSSSPQLKSED